MNIIELAKQAGIPIEIDWAGRPSTLVTKDGGTYLRGIDDLERFATIVRNAALEEAAGVCDGIYNDPNENDGYDAYYTRPYLECAAAIRALKEKT